MKIRLKELKKMINEAINSKNYPQLNAMLNSGDIFIDKNDYVGIASDGDRVTIGWVGRESEIEDYLSSYPTPEDW